MKLVFDEQFDCQSNVSFFGFFGLRLLGFLALVSAICPYTIINGPPHLFLFKKDK